MQRLVRNDVETLEELQDLSVNNLSLREKKAREYVADSFVGKMPSLIPFALQNNSILKLASYLLKYTTGSKHTLYQYVFGVHRFCKWKDKNPDEIVREASMDKSVVERYVLKLDDFIGDLQAEGLAPGTINNHVKGVKALFRVNGIGLTLPFRFQKAYAILTGLLRLKSWLTLSTLLISETKS